MNINPSDIVCSESIQVDRRTQRCDYIYKGQYLFTEDSYFPYNVFKASVYTQRFGFVLTKQEAQDLAIKFDGKFEELPYTEKEGEEFYLYFTNSDLAIKFCQSEEFDNLLSRGKI